MCMYNNSWNVRLIYYLSCGCYIYSDTYLYLAIKSVNNSGCCLSARSAFSVLNQGRSQHLETGCPKLAIVKLLGIQIFKGEHNLIYLDFNNKHVLIMRIIWRWKKKSILYLRLTFWKGPLKICWVSWGVLFKGLGVQKDTQTPEDHVLNPFQGSTLSFEGTCQVGQINSLSAKTFLTCPAIEWTWNCTILSWYSHICTVWTF